MTAKKLLALFVALLGLDGALIFGSWLVGSLAGGGLQNVLVVLALLDGVTSVITGCYLFDSELPWDRHELIERKIAKLERWHDRWDQGWREDDRWD